MSERLWSEGAKDKSGGSESSIELSEDVWTLRQLIEQVTDISQKASSRGVDLAGLSLGRVGCKLTQLVCDPWLQRRAVSNS